MNPKGQAILLLLDAFDSLPTYFGSKETFAHRILRNAIKHVVYPEPYRLERSAVEEWSYHRGDKENRHWKEDLWEGA